PGAKPADLPVTTHQIRKGDQPENRCCICSRPLVAHHDASLRRTDWVAIGGIADMPGASRRSGCDATDPNVWSGRALQEDFFELGDMRSCINVSGLCLELFVLRAIMDISGGAISLADRPQWAIRVTSVRKRREDRSSISFLILSQTSAGKIFRRLADHAT